MNNINVDGIISTLNLHYLIKPFKLYNSSTDVSSIIEYQTLESVKSLVYNRNLDNVISFTTDSYTHNSVPVLTSITQKNNIIIVKLGYSTIVFCLESKNTYKCVAMIELYHIISIINKDRIIFPFTRINISNYLQYYKLIQLNNINIINQCVLYYRERYISTMRDVKSLLNIHLDMDSIRLILQYFMENNF